MTLPYGNESALGGDAWSEASLSQASAMTTREASGGNPVGVIAKILMIAQILCGYYIPMSGHILWWATGVGAFVFGILYLQYLFSTHFFVDLPLSIFLDRACRRRVPDWCVAGSPTCYYPDAQDLAAFFFVIVTHVFFFGPRPVSKFNSAIFGFALLVYTTTLCLSPLHDFRITLFAVAVGVSLGVSKVLFFAAAFYPACVFTAKYARERRRLTGKTPETPSLS